MLLAVYFKNSFEPNIIEHSLKIKSILKEEPQELKIIVEKLSQKDLANLQQYIKEREIKASIEKEISIEEFIEKERPNILFSVRKKISPFKKLFTEIPELKLVKKFKFLDYFFLTPNIKKYETSYIWIDDKTPFEYLYKAILYSKVLAEKSVFITVFEEEEDSSIILLEKEYPLLSAERFLSELMRNYLKEIKNLLEKFFYKFPETKNYINEEPIKILRGEKEKALPFYMNKKPQSLLVFPLEDLAVEEIINNLDVSLVLCSSNPLQFRNEEI